ncbi:MAG TPA: pentapeptide repeat-containing protein, partial [Candidatus Nitrosocosmicus sp.]|nr:pentapeptide repeat-containing protein [Candidatus Nitrosocosmicus sp.]
MSGSNQDEGLLFLKNERIDEFNKWRMKNLTLKLTFDKTDLSAKNISNAFLNGISFIDCNFSNSNLQYSNLVQSIMTNSVFDHADLSNAIFMFTDLKNSVITNSNLDNTNFMASNLQRAD